MSDHPSGPSRDGSTIVLGVTGGIAAYKTAELVRLLTGEGYRVIPVMTPWATRFIGPLTLESLAGQKVRIDTPAAGDSSEIEHISLIRRAALLLIAPLTANTLAKMAAGLADNFLTTTYLAHRGKTLVCPAMNTAMLQHPATRRNLERILADGVHVCYGSNGELACGEFGAGRMAEPADILDEVEYCLAPKIPALQDKSVLVSAGPTCEDLDPIRFLTNRSSGKMGLALARAFRNAGARVTLVHGPVHVPLPGRVETRAVRSAAEMAETVLSPERSWDIAVMAAAVADYSPQKNPAKLKKDRFDGVLRLERTTDILAELGRRKKQGQLLLGFAAETENLEENARAKLSKKNLDAIFANDVGAGEGVFGKDRNRIWALTPDGGVRDIGEADKAVLARELVTFVAERFLS